MPRILKSGKSPSRTIRRALLAVSDRTGLVGFARGLARLGVELVSTSDTAKALKEAGLKFRLLESLAGHPRVHGGILAGGSKRKPIDLVAVNLHPFAKAAENAPPFSREAAESIDIGGADIIRTAAKRFRDVAVVVSPTDYGPILEELARSGGLLCEATRRRLSCRAFEHTAAYDAMIAEAWSSGLFDGAEGGWETFPQRLSLRMEKVMDLRYGENPHQKAALYARQGEAPSFEQLHGNDLSYNNLLDAFGTWEAVCEFDEPAAVIFKHVTPSGLGISKTLAGALENAWLCDPVSASGGVLAFNRTVDSTAAQAVCRRFFEVLCAPEFEPDAFEILKKKPNLRLVAMKAPPSKESHLRSLGRKVLVSDPNRLLLAGQWRVVTKRAPTDEEDMALRFAWAACKHVRSNAVVLAGPEATVGIGAGQMSRVDSVRLAGQKYAKYRESNPAPKLLVLASDAFLPLRDGIEETAKTGATAVVQPGGSTQDAEVIAAANENNLAMIFTGVRHSRH